VKLRYVGEEPREVSILPAGMLRAVQPEDVFDVPDEWVESYSGQPHFYQPADGSKWPEPEQDQPADQPPADDKPAEPVAKKGK
jgi:hypothetical protein